jgi:hypothetical protein
MGTRRGLFSDEALQSRLAENPFAAGGLVDLFGPIIKLQSLAPKDVLVLLSNIRLVFAAGEPSRFLVPDEALTAFMAHCNSRIGDAYFRTPRTTVKAFVQMLAVLDQNPGAKWQDILGDVQITADDYAEDDTSTATVPNPETAIISSASAYAAYDRLLNAGSATGRTR